MARPPWTPAAALVLAVAACGEEAREPLSQGLPRTVALALSPEGRDASALAAPLPALPALPPDKTRTLRQARCETCCDVDAQGRCLASCSLNGPNVPIATPHGDRPLRSLRLGDEVWTYDGRRIVASRIIAVEREMAPPVDFVRVTLRNGESFLTLPQHPLPDGGCLGELDELLAAGVHLPMPYFGIASISPGGRAEGRVYEILPDGDTGIYWAGGVPMASSIRLPPLSIEVDTFPVR